METTGVPFWHGIELLSKLCLDEVEIDVGVGNTRCTFSGFVWGLRTENGVEIETDHWAVAASPVEAVAVHRDGAIGFGDLLVRKKLPHRATAPCGTHGPARDRYER